MGTVNRKKEDLNVPVMVFCIVGVVLTVFGFMLMYTGDFRLNVFGTEGVVSSINTTSNNGEIVAVEVTLSYTANRSSYTATISNYDNPNVLIGDKVSLYYDFLEPSSVSLERSGYIGYIALIIGVILCIKTLPRFVRIIKDNYL